MRCVLAVVGRPRDAGLAAAIHDYETRAARYWPLEVKEVREERATSLAPDEVRKREGVRLREAVGGARVVACDEGGTSYTSAAFATWLQKQREAARDIAFVIGGAFGLDRELRDTAPERLTLAPWTLPHELARLVLAEQLYRAGTIGRGEPYHK
jgi:23S rRNA (pseudouridine1915-N3)-methyltransferase